MKVAAGIVGLLLFLFGLLVVIGGVIGVISVENTAVDCTTSGSQRSQTTDDCIAQRIQTSDQTAIVITVAGASLLVAGAALMAGATAAPRRDSQTVRMTAPMMPAGPPR